MRTVKEYFSLLKTIYICIFTISSLALIISLVTIESNRFSTHDIPYIVSCIIFMIVSYGITYSYSQKKIKEAKQKRGLREKLIDYRKALLISWIITDSTVIYSIICYIITGEHFFACTAVFSLALFLMNKPSSTYLIKRLDLASDEKIILENPKSAL